MSCPGGNNATIENRDGTRFILREITANLQNSPPGRSPRPKPGNEGSPRKGDQQLQQHDVKVQFIREFADATSVPSTTVPESSSLSSASSFQSLASTLSSKTSSGICVDSPSQDVDRSYTSSDIPGLDDLISACENINLKGKTKEDESFELCTDSSDNSPDQTFISAADRASVNGTRENSPINSPEEVDRNLNLTRDAASSIVEDKVDPNLNVTTEIKAIDLPASDCNLNVTREIKIVETSTDNYKTINTDFNVTTEIASEDLSIKRNFDLNVTKDLSEEYRTINSQDSLVEARTVIDEQSNYCSIKESFDLQSESFDTKSKSFDIQSKSFDLQSKSFDLQSKSFDLQTETFDLDETREVTREELDATRSLDVEDKSLVIKTETAELVGTSGASREVEKSIETFVHCDSDVGSLPVLNEIERALKKVDDELELARDREDEKLKGYEEFPLEQITPSLSAYRDNICPGEVAEKVIENVSDVQTEVIEATELEKFTSDRSKEITRDPEAPTLPSISDINSPSELNETVNLLLSSSSIDVKLETQKTLEVSEEIASISDKFSTIAENETCHVDSISTIQEPTFFNSHSPTGNDTKDSTSGIQDSVSTITSEQNEESSSKESKTENLNVARSEVEKPEEEKQTDCDKDLDATLSADDILGIPESDQYAEFVPQRQSTGIVPQRQELDSGKSELIAGSSIEEENFISRPISLSDEYTNFVPQKQSTKLDNFTSPVSSKLQRQRTPFVTALTLPEESLLSETSSKISPRKKLEGIDNRCNFAQLEQAANSVANDIFNSSLELGEENEHFVSAETELFQDPTNFDFLLTKTPRKNATSTLRDLSLYVKFDPLVSNTSMLPQGNIQSASPPVNEARNGDNNTTIPNIGTPKPNPAIAAIDRLLFYSPMVNSPTPANTTIQKSNDAQEKLQPGEQTSEETINMAKELELVRTTVLQLEEQLSKLKIDHEEALEQNTSYKEKINQLQTQLAQEIKHKNEITVVVDEYEISISRLVAERERDRKNLDLEKAKLQEELAAAKHHLDNTEAAFNDVHLKYERLKAVVATYKANEAELKESLEENYKIIKGLENRYEQVKNHAQARLEKANQDLDEIRKQNDSETVKLHAMLRKAELKSNSLAELVEQKTKENKELTQILDEVIARVGYNKTE